MEKEYYRVHEISKMYKITSRYVRTKIKQLKDSGKFNNRIEKDSEGQWLVHHLALPLFKRQRKQKQPYYALTVTFNNDYTNKDVETVMNWVCDRTGLNDLEFYYTIEKGLKTDKTHVHSFTNCKTKRKLIENLRLGFSKVGYKEVPVYDLEGWKNYITKEGNKIIEIKN
ncbi:hypothetical protein BST92_08235 [Nonlabens arenilitoris]|uniref:Uncharacterized protein n=1 Tax=Nonlabens arenilitoris TaxID=1217969 RepID=A0A2S7UAG0_9FLAO|nr:hypothetical protein [Nonlabens arenilitoris]PQJ31915.1 hypothetical protein BST92_08235 [Nonlabens arenilitoris]